MFKPSQIFFLNSIRDQRNIVDMHCTRNCKKKKIFFFFSKSAFYIFIKTCCVTARCAQAMLQKIHFNMLVKSNRVQIKYKTQDCMISPAETSERYRRGESDKSSKSYPGTRERKKKRVQFARCLCKAPALIGEINNTVFIFFFSSEVFFAPCK